MLIENTSIQASGVPISDYDPKSVDNFNFNDNRLQFFQNQSFRTFPEIIENGICDGYLIIQIN